MGMKKRTLPAWLITAGASFLCSIIPVFDLIETCVRARGGCGNQPRIRFIS